MNKTQIKLYSVDTKAFYNKEERNYANIKSFADHRINNIEEYAKKELKKNYDGEQLGIELKEVLNKHNNYGRYKRISEIANNKFKELIAANKETRQLDNSKLNKNNMISEFPSALTRTLGLSCNEVTTDLLIVRAYHYEVLESLIKNGFNHNGEHYIYMTSSAGQIRNKKCVFIKEDIYNKHEKTLMCGLTKEKINELGGMNLTKFLAYLALNSSATDLWSDFDIDRAIVVDDFETAVNGDVDYIDNKTFAITRKNMDVPIPHTDGFGMMLPSVSKKNFMVRLPWIKGLLGVFDFKKFCKTERIVDNEEDRYKVVDMYGKEYDIIKDDIQIIFTKSQFKLYKYYASWDEYKALYKQYDCQANICNVEEDNPKQANINYQMLQTLTDITEKEIDALVKPTKDFIVSGYTDINAQLEILGANRNNRDNFQEAIRIYPEMIQDEYSKSVLSDCLNKVKKEASYGKIKIDGKYTFLIPDVYAWCEYLFSGVEQPKGLLANNQVACKLFKDCEELDVLRSPHLYMEHAIRDNVANDKNIKKWFTTNAIYTSSHDLISKMLQFDNDGDKSLVVGDKRIIDVAKKNIRKYDVVPLYYEMYKADAQEINNDNIYESLKNGFKYGNVGIWSNKITNMWNREVVDRDAIKISCMCNNFFIDGAKTGVMLDTTAIDDKLKAGNGDMPYFFMYAKDKEEDKVQAPNNSTVNRIAKKIETTKRKRYSFNQHGAFRYATLLGNKDIEINLEIVSYYKKLERERNMCLANSSLDKKDKIKAIHEVIAIEMEDKANELEISYRDMVDMITKHLYAKKSTSKQMLWDVFGDTILENMRANIKKPLDGGYIMCECCGSRVKVQSNRQKYCKKCAKAKGVA